MPVTASLVAGGLSSAFGAYQYLQGQQLAKQAKRPTYEIPMELKNKLTSAQMAALEGMSEQERKQYLDNLQRVANFQMSEMGSRKAGLVGAAELGQTQADALTKLAVESENMRRENQRYLGSVQSEMAGEKQKEFELNKLAPYQSQVAAAEAMKGAGIQNVWSGLGAAQKGLSAADLIKKYLEDANKKNTIGNPPPIK